MGPERTRKPLPFDSRDPRSGPSVWLLPLGIALAVVALYWGSLPFPFQFDDTWNLVDNPAIQVRSLGVSDLLKALSDTLFSPQKRPVAMLSFAASYALGGLSPWGFRLANVLLHAGAALLVFTFLRTVGTRALGREPSPAVVALVALLWAIHPVQTNAVVYVIQRITALAAFFYLAAFLAYLRARRKSGMRSLPWFALSGGLFLLACGSKEIACVFPFALVLYEAAFHPGLRQWLRRNPWAIAVFLAGSFALFPWALHRYGAVYDFYPFTWQERVLTELRVVARYLGLLGFPHPTRLVLDYEMPVSKGLLSPLSTLGALALHAALLAAGLLALVRRPLYGFAILGFYLHLALESTVIPLDLAFEHRLYLPSVFLAVGAVGVFEEEGVRRLLRGPRLRAAAAAGLVLAAVWGAWTWQRLQVWRDPMVLWQDTLKKQPANPRAHFAVGQILLEQHRDAQALPYYLETLRLRPAFVDAHVGAGVSFWNLNRPAEATSHFLEAIRLKPESWEAHRNLGFLLAERGNRQAAAYYLERAERLRPK